MSNWQWVGVVMAAGPFIAFAFGMLWMMVREWGLLPVLGGLAGFLAVLAVVEAGAFLALGAWTP